MAKPVHPAAVHFPIAFLVLSYGLDLVNHFQKRLPNAISSKLPISTDMTRASYFLLCAYLITVIPALITGVREAVLVVSKQGLWETDETATNTKMRDKVKAMMAHAVFNDVVAIASIYVWYHKRANAAKSLAGKIGVPVGAAAYSPENWMIATEAPILVMQLMAANIGGVLAYNFGIGLNVGAGKKNLKKQ